MPHPAFASLEHRPWPIPARPWVMHQTWHDLLFAHWRLDPREVRALIAPGLELDLWEGRAWIGIVPFGMRGVRPRFLPGVPGHRAFPELNVRTYVTRDGKPGVHFLSLDAASSLAVHAARALYHLPYHEARMRLDFAPGEPCPEPSPWVCFASARAHDMATFRARYRPCGPVERAPAGSLAAWLTERYCMYTAGSAPERARRSAHLWRGEVHHLPWPLQPAEAAIEANSMAAVHGIRLPDEPPLLHFARELRVAVWAIERLV